MVRIKVNLTFSLFFRLCIAAVKKFANCFGIRKTKPEIFKSDFRKFDAYMEKEFDGRRIEYQNQKGKYSYLGFTFFFLV